MNEPRVSNQVDSFGYCDKATLRGLTIFAMIYIDLRLCQNDRDCFVKMICRIIISNHVIQKNHSTNKFIEQYCLCYLMRKTAFHAGVSFFKGCFTSSYNVIIYYANSA